MIYDGIFKTKSVPIGRRLGAAGSGLCAGFGPVCRERVDGLVRKTPECASAGPVIQSIIALVSRGDKPMRSIPNSPMVMMIALSAALIALPAAAQITAAEASGLNLGADNDYALIDLGNTTLGWNSGPVEGNVLLGQGLTANLSGGNDGGLASHVLFNPTGTSGNVLQTSSGDAGFTVTAAPEIDPASAAGGLALLVGGLVVLRGRKQQNASA